MNNLLYIVIPCFNEEQVIGETAARVLSKLRTLIQKGAVAEHSRIVFVDDGSKDQTWKMLEELRERKGGEFFCMVKLSANYGHQNALLSGLTYAEKLADMMITMDCDLQDDIEALDKFVEEYHNGCDIVYGVRKNRGADTFFKKYTAENYYKLMEFLGVKLVFNHADYRLVSRRALSALLQFREVNLFLRGIIPLLGFKTAQVAYDRNERFAGESKYPVKKMLAFAAEGITSFSIKPIRFITIIGSGLFGGSLVMLAYFLIRHLTGYTVVGWTSLAVSIWMLGGLQLLALGVIGEYVAKTYLETKHRPRFIVEKILEFRAI